jgi:hypothetical protein
VFHRITTKAAALSGCFAHSTHQSPFIWVPFTVLKFINQASYSATPQSHIQFD